MHDGFCTPKNIQGPRGIGLNRHFVGTAQETRTVPAWIRANHLGFTEQTRYTTADPRMMEIMHITDNFSYMKSICSNLYSKLK